VGGTSAGRRYLPFGISIAGAFGLAVVVAAVLIAAASAHAQTGPTLPSNDFEQLISLTGSQFIPAGNVETIPHPVLKPAPRANCNSASKPLNGVQGRVTAADVNSPQATQGWTCNTSVVGKFATPGGFRVWRYTDREGHVCAYYDTSLVSRAGVISYGGGPSPGVEVLDMSDPTRPQETAVLRTDAMLAPHESLDLNVKRGLLGAEVGNALTLPSSFAIYDVRQDCRHPVLQSQLSVPTGHESGFSPDGNTFWAAGGTGTISAIDVKDPKQPRIVWSGAMYSHGLNFSGDGNTMYQTDPINGNLGIVDVSQVQARVPNPQVRQISRITWPTASIPQNTVPLTIKGRRYLLEFDEFAFRFNPATVEDKVGGARLIDISDPAHPKTVSDLRLEVNMQDEHSKADGDPYPLPGKPLGYGSHYCAAPREVDPQIVACSFLNSGLRIFNIADPRHPREAAYYVSPPKAGQIVGENAGDIAFSQPAFDSARREVWYTDATSGFYVVKLAPSVWNPKACVAPARARHVTVRRGRSLVRVKVTARGTPVGGAPVRLRPAGLSRNAKTNGSGRATFSVRTNRRRMLVTVSSTACGGTLHVKARHVRAPHHRQSARFTG
jgi:hypothetical protein